MHDTAAVEPIPLKRLVPWLAPAAGFLLILWLVVFDQGQISQAGAFLHEFMHDGRHLFGAPCH